jgi:hypothetical protein
VTHAADAACFRTREVDHGLAAHAVRGFAHAFRDQVFALAVKRGERAVPAPIRSALVANRPVQFGFARMFEMLNDNPRIQIRIFGNLEEAQRWLRSSR